MKLASLISGGKDSIYALHKAIEEKHQVVAIVTIFSDNKESFMWHIPAVELTKLQTESLGIELIQVKTEGIKEKELGEVQDALKKLKETHGIKGITTGAIASKYQKERIDKMCEEIGIESIAPIWGRNDANVLKEMINYGMKIMITSVASDGLDESWLGRIIDEQAYEELLELNKKYGVHMLGEGGEFETLVLKAPLFEKELKVEFKKVWNDDSGYIEIENAELI